MFVISFDLQIHLNKGAFSILLLLLSIDCSSQIILNKPIDISIADIHFNANVISKNKIKSISVLISDKPDGSVITNTGAGIVYKFNEKGYITRYMYTILNTKGTEEVHHPAIKKRGRIIQKASTTIIPKYVFDTINVYVFYDSKNHIISKRTKIGDFFHSYYYQYNEYGQIRKEYHCNETNISGNKKEFVLGEQKIISSDIFEYTKLTNTQTKKKTLNDQLNVYKKAIINYDDKRNLISHNSELIVSCIRQENAYDYDSNNQLLKHTYVSNENGEVKLESIFEYETNGNLKSEKKFKNGILIFEIQYIYDGSGTLIQSEVDRDYLNATVIIKKYEYTFYEE